MAGTALAEGGLVVDLSEMRSVTVDPQQRVAHAEGGVRLGDLDHETQKFSLAAPVGLVSATGVAGLTVHGGAGWLLRKYGLTIDNMLSVDIVTADGQLKNASENENSDLFWAIRGGGGNFGVVTGFEFKLSVAISTFSDIFHFCFFLSFFNRVSFLSNNIQLLK